MTIDKRSTPSFREVKSVERRGGSIKKFLMGVYTEHVLCAANLKIEEIENIREKYKESDLM